MPTSTLTSKGQVTIPKAIRERLGLKAGDLLQFAVDSSGQVVIRSGRAMGDIFGLLKDFAPARPVTTDEMRAGVRARAARKYRSTTR